MGKRARRPKPPDQSALVKKDKDWMRVAFYAVVALVSLLQQVRMVMITFKFSFPNILDSSHPPVRYVQMLLYIGLHNLPPSNDTLCNRCAFLLLVDSSYNTFGDGVDSTGFPTDFDNGSVVGS